MSGARHCSRPTPWSTPASGKPYALTVPIATVRSGSPVDYGHPSFAALFGRPACPRDAPGRLRSVLNALFGRPERSDPDEPAPLYLSLLRLRPPAAREAV